MAPVVSAKFNSRQIGFGILSDSGVHVLKEVIVSLGLGFRCGLSENAGARIWDGPWLV